MQPLIAIASLPECKLGLRENPDGTLAEIAFMPPETPVMASNSPLVASFCLQLEEYLSNPACFFSLPLSPRGTPFQQRVWLAIRNIPSGHTRNYGELAFELNSAARAVGQACGANPFPLLTPCHRVLGKSGLGGFAHAQDGWLLETKKWLLRHEGAL